MTNASIHGASPKPCDRRSALPNGCRLKKVARQMSMRNLNDDEAKWYLAPFAEHRREIENAVVALRLGASTFAVCAMHFSSRSMPMNCRPSRNAALRLFHPVPASPSHLKPFAGPSPRQLIYVAMHNKSRIAAVAAFARGPNAGLIVLGGTLANVYRESDHHAGGPAPPACGLPRPLLGRRRRPVLLWG